MNCPIPLSEYPHILLAHGGGGRLMQNLIQKMFADVFASSSLSELHDGAVLENPGKRLAFTTDSFVVQPLFFPGGDIGKIAICGTVNDLAMCGAKPLFLSVGMILEEGFSMETLWEVVQSMKVSADQAGVQIVTGDTKVVEKGKGDGIFINTSGIGVIEHETVISPSSIQPGDKIVLSGDIGRHGMAIMAKRENLTFESEIQSDVNPLHEPALDLLRHGLDVKCLRDATRGGVASVLNELAQSRELDVEIEEGAYVVHPDVRGACEILGLDPLYVANEGTFVAVVSKKDSDKAVEILKKHKECQQASLVGTVQESTGGLLFLRNAFGTKRIVQMLSGEQLPRIC